MRELGVGEWQMMRGAGAGLDSADEGSNPSASCKKRGLERADENVDSNRFFSDPILLVGGNPHTDLKLCNVQLAPQAKKCYTKSEVVK